MATVRAVLDPREFQKIVGPFLQAEEGKYNLILGLVDVLLRNPTVYPDFRLLVVEESGQLAGAAAMTRPHPLALTEMGVDAVDALAKYVAKELQPISGASGPMPTIASFVSRFVDYSKLSVDSLQNQGIYQLESVEEVSLARGHARLAQMSDLDLVEQWAYRFMIETFHSADLAAAYKAAKRAIEEGTRYLWEVDGKVRAMAGLVRPTPNGRTVNAVYTPPAERGRGYATALVWTLSRDNLASGRKYCFLYTDMSNATSNAIYQKIGYRKICDAAYFGFAG